MCCELKPLLAPRTRRRGRLIAIGFAGHRDLDRRRVFVHGAGGGVDAKPDDAANDDVAGRHALEAGVDCAKPVAVAGLAAADCIIVRSFLQIDCSRGHHPLGPDRDRSCRSRRAHQETNWVKEVDRIENWLLILRLLGVFFAVFLAAAVSALVIH